MGFVRPSIHECRSGVIHGVSVGLADNFTGTLVNSFRFQWTRLGKQMLTPSYRTPN